VASIATLNTVNALTKEMYQGKLREQLQSEVIGLKRIERSGAGITSEIGGKYVTFPIRVSRNAGIGYREENGTLQDPGTQGYKRINIGLKYGYGRIRISGQTMELAESNPQSFASALDREMSGLKDDIAKDSARIFYGDGLGTMATVRAVKSTSTIPVYDAQNFFGQIGAQISVVRPSSTPGTDGPTYDPDTNYLNTPLGLGTATVISTAVLTVSAIDTTPGANTITVSNSTGDLGTIADGDILVRYGNYRNEPFGLSALVNTTKMFNLDDPIWRSVMNGNSGTNRPLSEGLMIKMTDDIRINGGSTSLILTSLGVRRAYFALLTQQRRYSNTKEFAGGLTGLAFNNGREIPIVEDVDAPKNKMWFLNEGDFRVYRDKDWSWLDTDGGIWKWVQNKDAFEAVLKQYWQIACERRNSQGLLYDVSEG
jgi:hypothetical protein